MSASATEVVRRILSSHPKKSISDPTLAPAGVFLLIYNKSGEYCVLLNKRTQQVEHHKGEISFPGGSKDPEDETLLQTALRETHEEMGVIPEHVELLGELDDVPTTTSFLINTYVGAIPYPYEFRPSDIEVAEVLEVPIHHLMDGDNKRDEVRVSDGLPVNSPVYSYRGHLVYGATARILERFIELLRSAPEEEVLWTKTQPSP